ncbi:MAG: NAD(P)H-dependent glycerol-3-phosphate dehydrogenase [Lachnospiraceae bacterium]|nr:NAD(P)H-dependent glycerol-3-phosphate dehydrogenase [Lachnospiraceae bacterium]
MKKVTVIGCGAWGMALASHLAGLGHSVLVWAHDEGVRDSLRKERALPKVFPGITFPEYIRYTCDMEEAVTGRDLLVFAVASPFTRSTAERFAPYIADGQKIVSVTKGIEDKTLMTQTQILRSVLPNTRIAALSGPTHAEEVIRSKPTLIVAASPDRELAEYVQDLFIAPYFRVYTSPDELGVEIGGSLKNVIALAAGMIDGLGTGDNSKAAIITRGMYEMRALAEKMGAMDETITGLSGIGDLIVTCMSVHSRNHRAGELIGQGLSVEEAMEQVGQVVEGYYSAKSAMGLAEKYGASLPITAEINRILFEGKSPQDALVDLMLRDRKMESVFRQEDLPECWKNDSSH